MKIRFRATLLVLLVGLVLLTVLAVGVAAFLNARSAAREMAGQILDQTSARVERQAEALVEEATDQVALTATLLKTGQLQLNDLPGLIAYWRSVLEVKPELTAMFVGLEATGESIGVSRLQKGRPAVWQSIRDPRTGRLVVREYWVEDFPNKPYRSDSESEVAAVQTRPWYDAARRLGRPIWTNAYRFLGLEGASTVVGVTHAVPVNDADGKLKAVVMADFDLRELCGFLKELPIGKHGFAFLVEPRADGSRRVIAHPRPEALFEVEHPGGQNSVDLPPADELADAQIRGFLSRLPGNTGEGVVHFSLDDGNYLGSYRQLAGSNRPGWLICTVLPEEDVLGHAEATSRQTVLITLAALLLALAISLFVSRQVARPLEYLAHEAESVGHLQIDARPVAHSFVREVDRLAEATEEMKAGLRSFQRYVPADLVRTLLNSGQEARLGGERREVTVYFSDIAGFTSFAESMPGEDLVAHLGQYLGALSEPILALDGTVDKFIGDSVMAFWGAPTPNPRHAAAACQAAWRGQQRLRELRPAWRAAGRPPCLTRIGIHTGEVVVGNIGSPSRMNYTVIGDTVNVASRLEGLCKYYGVEVLLSEATYRQAAAEIVARPLDWVAVQGRSEGILVYELVGLSGEAPPETVQFAQRYALSLGAYKNRDWSEALRLLDDVLKIHPDDGPSRILAARCRDYSANPPGEDWDAIHRMTGK